MSKARTRPALAVIAASVLAALTTGAVVYWVSAAELERATSDKFQALFQVRRARLLEYLESVREETRFWNQERVMREALLEFSGAFRELGPDATAMLQRLYIDDNPYPTGEKDNLASADDGSRYSEVHGRYHYWLRHFLVHRGVYDVFLFDPEGDLVYTSFKERDYATNLVTGPWKDTDLGAAFRAARDNPFPSHVAFFDFAPYEPSYGAPASFFSSPVLDDAGALLGVVAFQIPADRINDILQVTAGMGESGETYAVGEDFLMRSDSRFSEESTTLVTRVETVAAREALAGNEGLAIIDDYRGIPVLSAYGPLEFEGVRWSVMAEIDEAELRAPTEQVGRAALIAGLGSGAAFGLLAWLVSGRTRRSE